MGYGAAILILILNGWPGAAAAPEFSASLNALFEALRPAVVAVEAHRPVFSSLEPEPYLSGNGKISHHRVFISSGVLLPGGRLVVTTSSGVELGDSIVIRPSSAEAIPATLHREDRNLNIALLRLARAIPERTPPPVSESIDSLLAPKVWLAALGYSAGDSEPILTLGRLTGISYAMGRTGRRTMLRTSVPVFPGSSGGLLVDSRGRWVGLISGSCLHPSATTVASDWYLGPGPQVALALPVDEILEAVRRLEAQDNPHKAFLGVQVSPSEANAAGVGRPGVKIGAVLEHSPAADARLRAGDVILAVEGQPVDSLQALQDLIAQRRPGDTIRLEISRDGRSEVVSVQLADRRIYDQFIQARERERLEAHQIRKQIQWLERQLQGLRSRVPPQAALPDAAPPADRP